VYPSRRWCQICLTKLGSDFSYYNLAFLKVETIFHEKIFLTVSLPLDSSIFESKFPPRMLEMEKFVKVGILIRIDVNLSSRDFNRKWTTLDELTNYL
jgi:hypothetical protein